MTKQAQLGTTILALTIGATLAGLTGVTPGMPTVIAQAEAATPSKLGDLSKFRSIVVDTQAFFDKGELAAARARIKDLETSWDEAEAGIKPRAAADWHRVDKAIDTALDALRADRLDATACRQALSELIAVMDQMSGKA